MIAFFNFLMMKRIKKINTILLTVAMATLTTSCNSLEASSKKQITPAECEADSSFAFIPSGDFIVGNDREKRDFAYNISAWASANTESAIV